MNRKIFDRDRSNFEYQRSCFTPILQICPGNPLLESTPPNYDFSEKVGPINGIALFTNGATAKKSLPKNLSKVQRISEERCLLKLSHEEGEALMEEGRVIVMAFSDFTGRLCERIRFRYYPPREIEEYLQAIEPLDGEAGERGRQV